MATRSTTSDSSSIQEFYEQGRQLYESGSSTPGPSGRHVIAEAAKRMGVSTSHLNKARIFARLYNDQDLAELIGLVWPSGRRLGIGHVCQLIEVKDRKARRRLQAAAAKHGWSVRQLEAKRMELLGKDNRARRGGRLPRLPESPRELLLQLFDRVDQWCRWIDALGRAKQSDPAGTATLGDAPHEIAQAVRSADKSMRRLAALLAAD